jgi:4-amino-4-deoxy-L-arabinose transferase-like glycosyltransferase
LTEVQEDSFPGARTAIAGAWAARWRWGIPLVAAAFLARFLWVLAVPTVPVGDFATYRESANYLLEFGSLDHGFIYMPGFVLMLAGAASLGGDLLAQKMIGVVLATLAAAAIFGITARLADFDPSDRDGDAARNGVVRRFCPCPTAVVATLLYALWPAGVALASVVGTDVPAAALIMLALWALVAWGERRPIAAALGFGALMGLGAYVRAVALPLTLMSIVYWAVRRGRKSWRQAVLLTALTTAATLVVLLPWAVRNQRLHGALKFTDDHGGITALIGANPNSEGTYTRALNRMFKDLTGRTVLDEPHAETDRMAFDLAKDWTRFEPRYALGLVILKAERLFWSEWHLLYWPIGRPGVLVGAPERWFAAHMNAANRVADWFWYALCALFAVGITLAVAERRWRLLVLIPFQLALTATYAVFFAEPRYRVPIEMMAFPLVAFALRRVWLMARNLAKPGKVTIPAARMGLAVIVATLLFVAAPAISDAGERLRAAHRWAATVWLVDGQPRLAKWRRHGDARGPSPVSGAPNGVRLALGTAADPTEVEVVLASLPKGRYRLEGDVEGFELAAGEVVRVELATETGAPPPIASAAVSAGEPAPDSAATTRSRLQGDFIHAGGPLVLRARIAMEGASGAAATATPTRLAGAWISPVKLTTEVASP